MEPRESGTRKLLVSGVSKREGIGQPQDLSGWRYCGVLTPPPGHGVKVPRSPQRKPNHRTAAPYKIRGTKITWVDHDAEYVWDFGILPDEKSCVNLQIRLDIKMTVVQLCQ